MESTGEKLRDRTLEQPWQQGSSLGANGEWTRREAFVRGLQLAEMRKAAGVTQVELAATMGVSQARISKIESGEVAGIGVVDSYITALGGTMDIVVAFDGRVWRLA